GMVGKRRAAACLEDRTGTAAEDAPAQIEVVGAPRQGCGTGECHRLARVRTIRGTAEGDGRQRLDHRDDDRGGTTAVSLAVVDVQHDLVTALVARREGEGAGGVAGDRDKGGAVLGD